MENHHPVRWGWLKAMYICTFVVSTCIGMAMISIPNTFKSVFQLPPQDTIILGLTGSLFLALGLVSILGVRSPLKFAPVLLLELVYKLVWLAALALPLFLEGQFPFYVVFISVSFLAFMVGDLIAAPFSYLFAKK
jgi:hypothetical protein